MPFEKGHKLAVGRPKGSKNLKTHQWDLLGQELTREGADRYLAELFALKGKDYCERYEKILEYFRPKQARVLHGNLDGSNLTTPVPDDTQKDQITKQWTLKKKLKRSMLQEEKTS